MTGTTLTRWSPMAGLVYAVLYVVGLLLIVGEGIDEKSDAGIASYYADSGNRTGDIVGLFLVAVSLLFFLVFVSVLRERLRAADADGAALSGVAAGSGVAAAALFLAGAAAFSATAMAVNFMDEFAVDANLARLQFALAYAFLSGAVILGCGLVLATSALALRTPVLPTWMGWVGLVAVVLAVAEMFLLPVFVIPAWSLLVGILLAARAPTALPAAAVGRSPA